MDELKAQLEAALTEVNSLIEETESSIASLESQIFTLNSQLYALKEELTEYLGTKNNLETNISGLSRLEPVDPEEADEIEEETFVDPDEEIIFDSLDYVDEGN